MRDQLRFGMTHFELLQLPLGELLVHDAEPRPLHQLPAGLLLHPGAEVAIGREDDLRMARETVDDLLRIARGADDVAERLHAGGAVDVADDLVVRIALQPLRELVGRAAVGERAAGVQVRQQDLLVRVQDLRGFRHEMDAAEYDHLRARLRRLLRELERIAHEIREVLDLRVLVVVGEDHRVELAAEPFDPIQKSLSLGHVGHGPILTWPRPARRGAPPPRVRHPPRGRTGNRCGPREARRTSRDRGRRGTSPPSRRALR